MPRVIPSSNQLTTLGHAAGVLARLDLEALIFSSPAFLFPMQLPRPAAVLALGAATLVWLGARFAVRPSPSHNPLNLQALLLLVMVFPSLYASADMEQSLPKVTGLAFGAMLYVALIARARVRPQLIPIFFRLFALSSLALAAIGLVGTQWISKFAPLQSVYGRLPKLIESVPNYIQNQGIHPNELAGVLLFFIPLLIAFSIVTLNPASEEVKSRFSLNWAAIGWSMAAAFVLGTLLLTQSRSAILGLGVALALWAAYRMRWMRILLVAAAIGGLAGVYAFGFENAGTLVFGSDEVTTAIGSLSLAGRMEVWQRAINMLQDFPFTGVGLNMFPYVAQVLYPFFLAGPDMLMPHAHNLLLQTGVDFGIPGLVAYVGLLTVFFVMTARVMSRGGSRWEPMLAAGLFFGMMAHQVYGLTDAVALGARPDFVFWIVLALGASLHLSQTQPIAAQHRELGFGKV